MPTFIESNLLHETVATFLVENKMITADQQQEALLKSIETKQRIGTALISLGYIDAMSFYRALKRNQAANILECFRWVEGNYKFDVDATPNQDLALKMNPYRLLLHGVCNIMPMAQIDADSSFNKDLTYRVASNDLPKWTENQLGTNETRILNQLKTPTPIELLAEQLELSGEDTARKLYAFYILEILIATSELLPEPKPAPAQKPKQSPLPTPVQEPQESDPEETTAEPAPQLKTPEMTDSDVQRIARLHLGLADTNFFELLELSESASVTEIRTNFLKFAALNNPGMFVDADSALIDQVEAVFLKGVEAFSTLHDIESRQAYLKKLRQKKTEPKKSAAANRFKINTELLDASSQFKQGMKLLKSKKYGEAIEHFEFAYDVDPKPRYLAYLGWSRFLQNPTTGLDNLSEAAELDPADLEIKRLVRKSKNELAEKRR